MLTKTKMIEFGSLGVASAMVATISPLIVGSGIPPSQVTGAGVACAAVAAMAIVVGKPKS